MDYKVTDTDLTSIANAIRTKGGTSEALEFPNDFVDAISDIPTSGVLGTKTISANGTYSALSDNLDGYSEVVVDVAGGGMSLDFEIYLTGSASYLPRLSGLTGSTANVPKVVSFPYCVSAAQSALYNTRVLQEAYFDELPSIAAEMFRSCPVLKSVRALKATHIGTLAFVQCPNLELVSFPNVTTIGGSAFSNCSALTSFDFTNVTTIGESAFYHAGILSAIMLKTTSIAKGAFSGYSLGTAALSAMTNLIASAFNSCSGLKSLYLLGSSLVSLNAPFVSVTFSGIYVKESLYSSYISYGYWSRYSAAFVSLTDSEIESLLSEWGVS